MKRISLLAIMCSLTLMNASHAMNLHPAVQAELQKSITHGIELVNSINQKILDANELEKTRKNAKAAVLLATAPDQKKIAETEKVRFFAALKKDQTKVDNTPQLAENFFNAFKKAVIVFVATTQAAAAQQNGKVIFINGMNVTPELGQK